MMYSLFYINYTQLSTRKRKEGAFLKADHAKTQIKFNKSVEIFIFL